MSSNQVTVDSTLGAASVGFFVSAVVFGVLTIQAFTYFRRYPSDKPAYKVLVSQIAPALQFTQLIVAVGRHALVSIGCWTNSWFPHQAPGFWSCWTKYSLDIVFIFML